MKKICIVIPYFGKWPTWFELYMETCKYNSTIDWLFFTDNDPPKNICDNVKFIKISLEKFVSLLSNNLNIDVNIRNDYTYKICDFKPTWGIAFGNNFLKDYDFWGHGDVDVMYGNIRKFMTEKLLNDYEIISGYKNAICGHFTIYKNCNKINNLFKQIKRNEKILRNGNMHYIFDEHDFSEYCGKQKNKIKLFWERQFVCEPYVSINCDQIWHWNYGKTFGPNEKEYMYLHFRIWKKNYKNQKIFKISEALNGWNLNKEKIFIT